MASKFLLATLRFCGVIPKLKMLSQKNSINFPQMMTVRSVGGMIPPSQYDMPFPKRLNIFKVLKANWEIIPLFAATATGISFSLAAILWATLNKVDVVFKTHSRENISHTMDLRKPSVHKMIVINQKYEPWPEMQAILSKMYEAHRPPTKASCEE